MLLQKRDVVVLGGTTSSSWKDAGNDVLDLVRCLRQLDTVATNPLDAAIRMTRILHFVPESVAVLYSGNFGRFCLPCHPETGALYPNAYSKCKRGKKNKCPTCSLKIPPRFSVPQSKREIENDEDNNDDENGDESSSNNQPVLDIDSVLEIQTRFKDRSQKRHYSIDLRHFYCKCVPNLPPDLVCPLCRISDRRTLLLSAFSYQAEPSAAREQPGHMSLSFTPLMMTEKEQQPVAKRARRAGYGIDGDGDGSTAAADFPSEYTDMFLPTLSGALVLRRLFKQDCKHAMAIHCVSCQKFGLIAPARICMPCHLRHDEEEKSVGGVLFRPDREDPSRMHCRYCVIANNYRREASSERENDEEEEAKESAFNEGEQSDIGPSSDNGGSEHDNEDGNHDAYESDGGFRREDEHAYEEPDYGSDHDNDGDYY